MAVSVKTTRQGKDVMVAACDAQLLGKTLKFGRLDFPIRKEFYGGKILTAEEALTEIRSGTTVNLLGKTIVDCALKAGLIHPEAVLCVSGVPHALIVKI